MKDAGLAHMGVGRGSGKNKAEDATRIAINSPLLETSIQGAKGIIVNITGPMDMGLEEVELAAEMVKQVADPDALFMMGTAFDDTLEDELRVTVIATGFGEVENPVPNQEEAEPARAKVTPIQGQAAPREDRPDCVPAGVGAVMPPKPLSSAAVEPPEPDPFDDIFRIFNNKK